MTMVKYISMLVGFLLVAKCVFSQDLENLPPSIKWQQIQSKNFRVIFPKGYEKEALRTTNILESIHDPASQSLTAKPRRFPIVLQTHYAVPNGFVTVGPFRSEFFMFSPQDYNGIGNDLWLEHLASHEYRHMVQFRKALSPFNKVLYAFMGEFAPAIFAGMAAPSWFWEGDAVGVETAMGHTGRGRTPKFSMAFRANTIEKGGFNYYKQHLRSFRDFVPNHYLTGYLMTTDLKTKYGADVWDKIVHKSFRAPFIPFAFSNSIKKVTGNYLRKSYELMLEDQKQMIQAQLSEFDPSAFDIVNQQQRKVFTNYDYPQLLSDGKVICLKAGWSDIDQLVMLDTDGSEKKLLELGILHRQGYLTANDSIIVWTEYEFDPRWRRLSYSVIKKFNFITNEKTTLTSKSRYSAAAVSSTGQIVGIRQSVQGINRIDLLNNNGQVVKWFESDDNSFYSMPTFINEKQIVVLKHYNGGKGIVTKDLETGNEEVLIFSTTENFGSPMIRDGILYYNAASNGIDNLFAFDLQNKKRYQVTKSRFGAFNASVSGNKIVYNDYTADGMDVTQTNLNRNEWTAIETPHNPGGDFYQTMVNNENIANVLYSPESTTYRIKKYPKTAKSFRPTSWGLFIQPDDNKTGAYLRSKDILSTTSMSFGTEYKYNEKIWRHSGLISYQGMFTILDVGFELGKRSGIVPLGVNEETNQLITERREWTENTIEIGARVPFVLTNSNYLRQFDIEVSTELTTVSNYTAPLRFLSQTGNGNLYALNFSTSYYRLRKRSRLDLAPQWGQTIFLHSTGTPFGGDYDGDQFAIQSNLFFPSLFPHHSIRLKGGFLSQDTGGEDVYIFSGPISFSRGYDYPALDDYTLISLNYKLPLMYMDWHIGPVVNFQRVYANVFYDQANGKFRTTKSQFASFGAEVHLNFNFMRFLALLDVGLRYSYRRSDGNSRYELLIGNIVF